MIIEKNGIDLSAVYRPLNNIFLNKVMEKIRKNYICKKQIPKGKIGTRNLLKAFIKGSSIAIMIDQRVSEGSKIPFFKEEALTTTIPAQLIKRFNCDVVPVHIERINDYNFTISFFEPIRFNTNDKFEEINLSAINAALDARKECDRDDVLVAGSLSHQIPYQDAFENQKERDKFILELCNKNSIPVQVSMGGGYSELLKNIIEAHSNTFRLAQEIYF